MKPDIREFFIKLFLFMMPLCLIFIYIEYRSQKIPNSYSQKKKMIENQSDSINILVLGSSNAYKDIDPEYFSCKGLNFGNSSQTLFYDMRLCLKYLGYLPRLKGVIISLSYISFYFELNETPDGFRDYFYFHYYGIRHPSLNLLDPKTFCYTALYTRNMIIDNLINPLEIKKEIGDIQPNGWERAPLPENPGSISDSSGIKRLRFHETLINPKNRALTIQYLDELIGILKKRNIAVYLVTPPVCETYFKWINPLIDKANHNITSDLCRKFGITYLDYFRDPRFTKDDFYDNDHLNYLGAKKLSCILDQDIVMKICDKKLKTDD